ncbi:MAG: cell division protein ZipA C-terminal FtsZ-binding domain-containing protein [Burkholderiales bacterium]|nr:cell division protein ZipA C-terminal FtsZ-binding domain-containing protein [Burkholderiales bacterium]
MSPLQLGLIVGGILLVVGVLVYNWWQERRVRRRIVATFSGAKAAAAKAPEAPAGGRVEPTLRTDGAAAGGAPGALPAGAAPAFRPAAGDESAPPFAVPMDVVPQPLADEAPAPAEPPTAIARGGGTPGSSLREPDPEIECVITLQPAKPVGVGSLAAGLHARMGKRLRWFGRTQPDAAWQALASDTRGEFVEVAACLLLADRNGAASRAQLDTFVRVIGELAPLLPAAMSVPDAGAETGRAEALDRLCADVDVQIGLTVVKQDAASIPGTKLRGIAEAAGFRLASGGRFELVQEDTGAVLYTLQNLRNEPFTVDTLRLSATNGVVLVLDVPRVADPARAFDQMKLAARRLAQTLGAELVDDNRRLLDDAALAAIRRQVEAAATALRECGIEPGSPRALALFGA